MAKIDWIPAKRYYISDEKVSYADVAHKFGVSKTAVKERAKKENWQKLRKTTLLRVDQKLPEKLSESLAKIQARQAWIGKLLQQKGLEVLLETEPRNFKEAVQSVQAGIQIEREALKMNTPAETNVKQIINNWAEGKG